MAQRSLCCAADSPEECPKAFLKVNWPLFDEIETCSPAPFLFVRHNLYHRNRRGIPVQFREQLPNVLQGLPNQRRTESSERNDGPQRNELAGGPTAVENLAQDSS